MSARDPLRDIEEVRRCIALYAQLLDDGRLDDWADLFTEAAEFWSVPGTHLPGAPEVARLHGRQAIVAAVGAVRADMRSDGGGAIHFGGVPLVEITGDTARAWWDFLILHTGGGPAAIPFCGRYAARLVRGDDGNWRFTRRISVRAGHDAPPEVDTPPLGARRVGVIGLDE